MIGRLTALPGWMAWQVARPLRRSRLRRASGAVVVALSIALLILAALPIVVPLLDPQPTDAGVDEVHDGAVTAPGTWLRMRGRIVPLADSPTGEAGSYGLLIDAEETLRSIVVRGAAAETANELVTVTGRLAEAAVVVEEELPIEATVAGTPPRVVADRIVELDPVAKPVRSVLWPLGLLPAALAVLLLIGARTGYPVFRTTTIIDVLAAPLGVGERLPAAYGGRVGPHHRDLADPGAALLLVRRGSTGSVLTAQPLADPGDLPPGPVTIGGGWTSGRVGDVHTLTESIPALAIRSELVDATFLFARTAERDRVAALVTVER
jgi:hypothetical protein